MGAEPSKLAAAAQDLWSACPPGTMRHVAERLRAQQRWSFFGQAGLAAVLLLAAGGGLWFAVAQFTADPFAPIRPHGMTCGEVLDQLPDYLAGRIEDAPTIATIENHLA